MSKKTLFAPLGILIILAMVLVACGPAETPTPEIIEVPIEVTRISEGEVITETIIVTATPEEEDKTLVMWATSDLDDTETGASIALKEAISSFEATTGIQVQYELVNWEQMAGKLALIVQSGGEVPDIVEASSQEVQSMTWAYEDITELVASYPFIEEVIEAEKRACVINGQRLCVAGNIAGTAWYYVVEDFPNGWPTTTQDWMIEAKRLKDEGKYISSFMASRYFSCVEQSWAPFFYSNGGSIFDDDGQPDWANPEVVEVIEWMREMFDKGYIPETNFTGDWGVSETVFMDRRSSSFRGGSWSFMFMPGLDEDIESGEVKPGIAPSFNGGPNYVELMGQGWGIPKGAKNIENALSWINYWMSAPVLSNWATMAFRVPTTGAAMEMTKVHSDFYKWHVENMDNNGFYMESSPCYVEALTRLAETLQEIMLNPEMDPMQTLQDIEDEVSATCGK